VLAALPFVVVVQERNQEEVRVEEIEVDFSLRKGNFWMSHQMCWKNVGRSFRILIKKHPVRKLSDESNEIN
jgi:hypothetical protein